MSAETINYRLGEFVLDVGEHALLLNGTAIALKPKAFELLLVLVGKAGQIVEKQELMDCVWPDRFVEEGNLKFTINQLRRALGDNAHTPSFIETIPRRGYRFIASVEKISRNGVGPTESTSEKQTLQVDENDGTVEPRDRRFILLAVALITIVAVIGSSAWLLQNRSRTQTVLNAPYKVDQLSETGDFGHSVVSSDGKNLFYTSTTTGRTGIWLRQLDTANNINIVPVTDDLYFGLALSPDSNFLYFVRSRPQAPNADIYRISVFGGTPQKIVENAQGWISVSPDLRTISFIRCQKPDDQECGIWTADPATGQNERKVFAYPDAVRASTNAISPDGRTIAFAIGESDTASNRFGISEVDIESGREWPVLENSFFNIKALVWLPGSNHFLITASRFPNKSFHIWEVNGNAVRQLTHDDQAYSDLSISGDLTRLVATLIRADFRLKILPLDGTPPRSIAGATHMSYAEDGRLFFSSTMTGNEEIWSMNPDGSDQRQLTNNESDDHFPVATEDGKNVFFASNRSGELQIWRMNADGSSSTQITTENGGLPISISPDGAWLYYRHGLEKTLWRVLTGGGSEQRILNTRSDRFAVSPDGTMAIAFGDTKMYNQIKLVSTSDGRVVEAFTIKPLPAQLIQIAWRPDNNAIGYVLADSLYGNRTLWEQDLAGGEPRRISDLGIDQIPDLKYSPTGNTYAIVQGRWLYDAVLISGLK